MKLVIIETWTEIDPDGDGEELYNVQRVTAPDDIVVKWFHLPHIKQKAQSFDDYSQQLQKIHNLKQTVKNKEG